MVDAARAESTVTVRACGGRRVGVVVVVGRVRNRTWPAVEACLRCVDAEGSSGLAENSLVTLELSLGGGLSVELSFGGGSLSW